MLVVLGFFVFVCGVIVAIAADNPAGGWVQLSLGAFWMIYGSVRAERKDKLRREQEELDELIQQHDAHFAEQERFRAYLREREPQPPAAEPVETPEKPCVPMRSGPRRVTFRRTPAQRPESPNDP